MKRIKLFFATIAMLVCCVSASAEEVKIGDLYYNIITKAGIAEVIKSEAGEFPWNVVIPETIEYNENTYSVTSISSSAFYGKRTLYSIEIPKTITFIGDDAFASCQELRKVYISDIAAWCNIEFQNDKKNNSPIDSSPLYYAKELYVNGQMLKELIIPDGVTDIKNYAFLNCDSLTSVEIPNSVTNIGDKAFVGCGNLTSVEIPNSVTNIGDEAFSECTSLISVSIGKGVKNIGDRAFCDCKEITTLEIGNSVDSIGTRAFRNCEKLTSVIIPNSVSCIGNEAFRDCKNIKSVAIGSGLKVIGLNAFYGCNGIEEVHISDIAAWCNIEFNQLNPLSIAGHLYMNGEEITSLEIPDCVTRISDSAFRSCSNLTSVSIPNSVTSIGNNAFFGCTGLTSVSIPNSVTNIGSSAFSKCSGLTSVTISNNVTSIGNNAFASCSGLTSVTIPNSVTNIGSSAFSNCTGLTSITIPNSVTSIGQRSFSGCSGLKSLTIGNSISSIGLYAFAGCEDLSDVYCLAANVPTTKSNAFEESYPEYVTLHVPAASIEEYINTIPWSSFGKIVTLETGDVPEIQEPVTCAVPTIAYQNGKLVFGCETEDVEFISEITDADIKKHYENEISLTATYNISVYATKEGYKDSEVAKATLCWIDVEPKTEGVVGTDISNVKALPVVMQANGGVLTVNGADDGTLVEVYTIGGTKVGSDVTSENAATVNISHLTDNVVIVKVGGKAIKMIVK